MHTELDYGLDFFQLLVAQAMQELDERDDEEDEVELQDA